MKTTQEEYSETTARNEAICRVLDHLWDVELNDFCDEQSDDHIFHQLVVLANSLNGVERNVDDSIEASYFLPEPSWRLDGGENRTPSPGDSLSLVSERHHDVEWTWEGCGSRYRFAGSKPSLVVIVGWDRPLSTYFAQVWEIPDGVSRHEEGELLLWLGTMHGDVSDIEALANSLSPYATLPVSLAARLSAERINLKACTR